MQSRQKLCAQVLLVVGSTKGILKKDKWGTEGVRARKLTDIYNRGG
jgi:hypothetical protein